MNLNKNNNQAVFLELLVAAKNISDTVKCYNRIKKSNGYLEPDTSLSGLTFVIEYTFQF